MSEEQAPKPLPVFGSETESKIAERYVLEKRGPDFTQQSSARLTRLLDGMGEVYSEHYEQECKNLNIRRDKDD